MGGSVAGGGGAEAMDAAGGEAPLLEAADAERRESLQRENVPDPLAGEQTWPTDEVNPRNFRSQSIHQQPRPCFSRGLGNLYRFTVKSPSSPAV